MAETKGEKTETHADRKKKEVGARTVRVASSMMFGKFIVFIIAGITFLIVARILGPSVYGVYTLALSFSGFFSVIADLGVATAISKFVAEYSAKRKKEELNKVISNSYASAFLSGLAFTLIAFLMSNFIAVHVLGNPTQTYIVQIVSFLILGGILFNVSFYTMIGFGKGQYVAIVMVVQAAFQAVLAITLSVMGFGALAPILGILLGYIASISTVFVILKTKFGVNFRMPSFDYIKRLVTFSSQISVYNGLRGFITNLGPIVLGIVSTTAIVGNFGVALRTSNIISEVVGILGAATLPMFAYTLSTKEIGKSIGKFYNYTIYATVLLVTPVLLYLAILAKQFSYTAFGAKYALAPGYLSIMSIGTFLWILATYSVMLLISANKVRQIMKYSIVIFIIELLVLFTLVPYLGGIGLAVMLYVISPSLIAILMLRAMRVHLDLRLELSKPVRVLIAGAISAAFLLPILFFLQNHYVATLIIGAIEQMLLYPVIVGLIGAARREDLRTLVDVVGGIPVINRIVGIFARYTGHFIRS